MNAFAGQNIEHELVSRPEGVFWETGRAQAVLVSYKYQLVLGQLAGNASQGADGTG